MDNQNIRVVALYRASTKAQTDKENNNDIPTQKKIVQEYIYRQPNWNIVRELTEGGISGFKTSEKDRDALQIIKAMAVRNELDVLCIYMSDRLGRLSAETPLIVKFLNDHNVRVWSVTEGEIKADTHTDTLLTFIRYWQSEGESQKTSQRVSDYLIAAVEEGRFKGGNCIPLGYMLVDNGKKNFKGRPIKDFVINPDEIELVKLIYYLSMKMNYGQRRIAMYLNEHGYKTREGNPWRSASIQLILKNPIYKGQFSMYSKKYKKKVYSPIIEHLVIIPEVEWEENRRLVEARTYKKNPKNFKDVRNTHGKLLLSGIIFCGHCGEKLTTFLERKRYKKANGDITINENYRYRCMSFYKRGAVKCDGQSAYGSKKINTIVIDEVKQFMLDLQEKNLNEEFIKNIKKQIKDTNNVKIQKQNLLSELYNELKTLKDEVVKSLMGKSQFTPEMLKEIMTEKEKAITTESENLDRIENDLKQLNEDIFNYKGLNNEVVDWNKRFDNATDDMKKAMLLAVVEKVLVFKDEIEITFNVKIETYKANSTCINTNAGRTALYYIHGLEFKRSIKFAS